MTIFLKDLIFHACHGLYPGEDRVGGRFVVNVEIEYDEGKEIIRTIENTINYETVFRLVEKRMYQQEALLETLVMEIALQILSDYKMAQKATVRIEKSNPPIEGIQGSVAVEYTVHK
ncbi:MAG: dihydroneopterin aldolase [Chitinophagaceae bacterium]|nr:dihydroneopterin aldolase [Chitinophagaceae bacterium]